MSDTHDSYAIPAIAKTAYGLLRSLYKQDDYERDLRLVGDQTVSALRISDPAAGWVVDFNAGVVRRTAPPLEQL